MSALTPRRGPRGSFQSDLVISVQPRSHAGPASVRSGGAGPASVRVGAQGPRLSGVGTQGPHLSGVGARARHVGTHVSYREAPRHSAKTPRACAPRARGGGRGRAPRLADSSVPKVVGARFPFTGPECAPVKPGPGRRLRQQPHIFDISRMHARA